MRSTPFVPKPTSANYTRVALDADQGMAIGVGRDDLLWWRSGTLEAKRGLGSPVRTLAHLG